MMMNPQQQQLRPPQGPPTPQQAYYGGPPPPTMVAAGPPPPGGVGPGGGGGYPTMIDPNTGYQIQIDPHPTIIKCNNNNINSTLMLLHSFQWVTIILYQVLNIFSMPKRRSSFQELLFLLKKGK